MANGTTLFDELAANETVARHLSQDQLKTLLDPANYVGQAHAFVDAAIVHSKQQER